MSRFLIVYTMAVVGTLGGAALGAAFLRPNPMAAPSECGMWALPAMFLGGVVGAALMTWLGLRLTRTRKALPRVEQSNQGTAERGAADGDADF